MEGFSFGTPVTGLIKPRFWTLSIVTGYKNTTFRELALLPSSGPVSEASSGVGNRFMLEGRINLAVIK
jgi:hypothetical protein